MRFRQKNRQCRSRADGKLGMPWFEAFGASSFTMTSSVVVAKFSNICWAVIESTMSRRVSSEIFI